VSKPLKRVDKELRGMIAEMFDLMYEHEGVGLAANQVDLPYRLFVMNPTGDSQQPQAERVFINPVLSGGKGRADREEGCLSLPGVHAPVTRHTKIRIAGFDASGNEVVADLEGFDARVVQHEVDHLDGTMFTDRLSPTELADIRHLLDEFEIAWESQLATGEAPSDEQVAARLAALEMLRT
jgi:peptide deformylase